MKIGAGCIIWLKRGLIAGKSIIHNYVPPLEVLEESEDVQSLLSVQMEEGWVNSF